MCIYIQYTHTNMHTKITYIILYICAFIHRVHMSSHCQGFNVLFNSWPGLSASSSSRREFLHGALPRWFHCRSRAIAAVSAAVPVINSLGILQKLRSLEPSLFSACEPVRDQTPASCTKTQKPWAEPFLGRLWACERSDACLLHENSEAYEPSLFSACEPVRDQKPVSVHQTWDLASF